MRCIGRGSIIRRNTLKRYSALPGFFKRKMGSGLAFCLPMNGPMILNRAMDALRHKAEARQLG
jgi:hypothetical protein